MRGSLFRFSPHPASRRSLSARGQLLITFAGLGFCVAFALLALGGYLIQQEFENPVKAQSIGLLLAALLIATAITLLYCLLHPSRKSPRRIPVWPAGASWERRTVVVARSSTGTRTKLRADLPWRGRYEDRTRIRIQRESGTQARGIAGK
jgi:hypothetical protein